MNGLEQTAAVLYGEQKYPEALDIYLSLYKKNPKTEKYSIFCGNCFDAMGDQTQAIKFYKRANRLNPVSVTSLTALANLYYHQGDYKNSAKFSKRILQTEPGNISALLNLGNIAYCQAAYARALRFYEAAYQQNEKSYIAVINLANTCYDLKHYAAALEFAQKALQIYPSSTDAYLIRGNALLDLGKYAKAEQELMRAAELSPRHGWVYAALSRLYQKQERWEEALASGWKAVVCQTDENDDQHINFGYLLYEYVEEGNPEEIAQRYAQKWLQKFIGNKVVMYMANAILNNQQLQQAEPAYIGKMFDIFAADFDNALAGLDYQAPQHVAKALKAIWQKPFWKRCRCLDLGCGTGLCGEKIKPVLGWCRLDGVDLSEKMLDQAAAKKIYHRLTKDEITHFLLHAQRPYQVITAADVLTYFGDLKMVFHSVADALCQGGIFVFTISENGGDEDYRLLPSGRFVHNFGYVQTLLKKSGFRQISAERKPLRTEGDHLVWGYVIVARKEFTVAK